MTGRRITAAVTMLVLLGILVAGAVLGWRFLVGGTDSASEPTDESSSSACPSPEPGAPKRLSSRQVRVSVYNAGNRSGVANSTLDALLRRGFVAGDAANAPDGVKVRRVQVWTTVQDDPMARLVALQFGKRTPVIVSDEELGPGVDVIVGNGFDRLRKAPRSLPVDELPEACAEPDA